MNIPHWVKPGIFGAVIGAALVGIAGFSVGGWVTEGSATQMANAISHNNVIAALVPVCVANSQMDTDRDAKLETILAASSSYQRRNALMESGWATVPGSTSPDRDLAQACLTKLNLNT